MRAIVIGGGPAGLMAAEQLLAAGFPVHLYDAMPSLGRKFLLAGRGGLNLTHVEPQKPFLERYYQRQSEIKPWLKQFDAAALRAWADELGAATFVGSSGRIFPREMKAAPLLRGWLRRLRQSGLITHARHRWLGWNESGQLCFQGAEGLNEASADVVIFALGGASWPKLGSDGSWADLLAKKGIDIAEFRPSNCGFEVAWSDFMRQKYAGQPLKNVVLRLGSETQPTFFRRGELVISEYGLEGNLIYAASALLRDEIELNGMATIYLDLAPDRSLKQLRHALARPRGSKSVANHLRQTTGVKGARVGLLREQLTASQFADADLLATRIKAMPITLLRPRPIAEAISSAGGIRFSELDKNLMLTKLPGYFCAGEMIDWEAPTGGYLLTACFASGKVAGQGAAQWLRQL